MNGVKFGSSILMSLTANIFLSYHILIQLLSWMPSVVGHLYDILMHTTIVSQQHINLYKDLLVYINPNKYKERNSA